MTQGIGLSNVLSKIQQMPFRESLMVFDLDSTLFDLTRRVSAILATFPNHEMLAKYPKHCELLKSIQIHRTDWGLKEPLARIGIIAEDEPDFFRDIQRHWAQGFFSNEFLELDFPLPGAVSFVEECLRHGSEVLYLTGRDVKRMQEGTLRSLQSTGFPLDGDRSRLVLKPTKDLNDAHFKADIMVDLVKQYRHLCLFENEPVNINAVIKRVPSIDIVLLDTCHSGLESVDTNHIKVTHFDFRKS
ncbi:MAG: HAD family hydrolase [Bdellovibrionales bacterium]|jgi:hypothetical protein|nr:HAD family hydrolase [Bdellovibrionales bacterium]